MTLVLGEEDPGRLTLDQCFDQVPTVTREEALRMLEFSQATLQKPGRSA